MWSLGVCLYEAATQGFMFPVNENDSIPRAMKSWLRKGTRFMSPSDHQRVENILEPLNEKWKKTVSNMCHRDPTKRPSMSTWC